MCVIYLFLKNVLHKYWLKSKLANNYDSRHNWDKGQLVIIKHNNNEAHVK